MFVHKTLQVMYALIKMLNLYRLCLSYVTQKDRIHGWRRRQSGR